VSRAGRKFALLLLTALLASGLLYGWPDGKAPAEPFVLIDGRRLEAADLRGGPVLLNFWATSCPTCLQEIPELVSLHREYAARGLTVIGVAMPYDPPPLVVDFARSRQLPYAVALDLEARLVRAYGDVRVTPTHILIGPDGRILQRHIGRLDLAATRRHIEQLLAESQRGES
jgi:peroxiredoxin